MSDQPRSYDQIRAEAMADPARRARIEQLQAEMQAAIEAYAQLPKLGGYIADLFNGGVVRVVLDEAPAEALAADTRFCLVEPEEGEYEVVVLEHTGGRRLLGQLVPEDASLAEWRHAEVEVLRGTADRPARLGARPESMERARRSLLRDPAWRGEDGEEVTVVVIPPGAETPEQRAEADRQIMRHLSRSSWADEDD